MFSTVRGNQAASGTTIDVTNVGAARAAMMKQKNKTSGRSGEVELFIQNVPNIILTGPDRSLLAEQLVTSVVPNQTSQVNPFSGKLEALSDAWISGNRWYLINEMTPNYQWGYLQGKNGPEIMTREGWNPRGVEYYLAHDIGIDAVDFRGGYYNPGA
jgi:hypothetical protein